jgi:hypothetical protein
MKTTAGFQVYAEVLKGNGKKKIVAVSRVFACRDAAAIYCEMHRKTVPGIRCWVESLALDDGLGEPGTIA